MAKEQINIRVGSDKKERWKEIVEESPEYDSLTHLISLSVEKELSGENGGTHGDASLDAEASDTLQQVAGSTDRIEGTLSEVQDRLRTVEQRIGQSNSEVSVKAAIRETLDERPPDAHVEELPEDAPADAVVTGYEYDEFGLTSRQIAARLNADESTVRETLREMPRVRSVKGGPDNETYYFLRGDR
jgi:hypothetical protein